MGFIDRPLVAILLDDAGHNVDKFVAAFSATGFQVFAVAFGHGNGLSQSDPISVPSIASPQTSGSSSQDAPVSTRLYVKSPIAGHAPFPKSPQ
jgi:hypothetical protein